MTPAQFKLRWYKERECKELDYILSPNFMPNMIEDLKQVINKVIGPKTARIAEFMSIYDQILR
jgi:hypothetical protein